jgi:hypothetical protein
MYFSLNFSSFVLLVGGIKFKGMIPLMGLRHSPLTIFSMSSSAERVGLSLIVLCNAGNLPISDSRC